MCTRTIAVAADAVINGVGVVVVVVYVIIAANALAARRIRFSIAFDANVIV